MNNNNLGYLILEQELPKQYQSPQVHDISKDKVIIETVLQEAEEINRNKRRYTKRAIESGINHPMFQDKLKRKNLFG